MSAAIDACWDWLQVLVSDPLELEKIRQRESDITKERIEKILASGANVILTTKGIDDMSLKYLVEAGAIAARRVPKDDLRWVPPSQPPKPTGGTGRVQEVLHCSKWLDFRSLR